MTDGLLVSAFLVPATVAAVYYAVLTAVGWRRAVPPPFAEPRTRFAVLIPAHDEERTLPATLDPVFRANYPAELIRVLVVADNCTDGTAAVARRCGAKVVQRIDPDYRGKGYALAFALPYAMDGDEDAVLMLDADGRLDPTALRAIDAELTAGAEAVQAAVRYVRPDAGPTGLVAAVGSEIENGVQAGLGAFGRSAWLRGTGMAFRRDVLKRVPWDSFGLAEDAEYAGRLRAAGIKVRFAANAVVSSDPPPGERELCGQRRRWRAALFTGGKSRLDRAVSSKPLVLAHLTLTLIVAVAGPTWMLAWASGLVALTAAVYLRAIRRVGGGDGAIRNVWRIPAVVARLAWVTAGGLTGRGGTWERTARAAG